MRQLALVEPSVDDDIVRRRLVLPFLPPSKNKYDGWQPMWKHSLRQKWYRKLEEAYEAYQFPKDAHQVAVATRLVFASKRNRDWQNYAPLLLHVIPDSLVRYGVIPDDTPERFTVGPNAGIEFAVDRRQMHHSLRQRTELSFAIRV